MIQDDLSDLPDELIDYAFDQFEDRLYGIEGEEAIRSTRANGLLVLDREAQTVEIKRTITEQIILDALREKIEDVQWEIERGERDDFDHNDIKEWRRILDRLFSIEEGEVKSHT